MAMHCDVFSHWEMHTNVNLNNTKWVAWKHVILTHVMQLVDWFMTLVSVNSVCAHIVHTPKHNIIFIISELTMATRDWCIFLAALLLSIIWTVDAQSKFHHQTTNVYLCSG